MDQLAGGHSIDHIRKSQRKLVPLQEPYPTNPLAVIPPQHWGCKTVRRSIVQPISTIPTHRPAPVPDISRPVSFGLYHLGDLGQMRAVFWRHGLVKNPWCHHHRQGITHRVGQLSQRFANAADIASALRSGVCIRAVSRIRPWASSGIIGLQPRFPTGLRSWRTIADRGRIRDKERSHGKRKGHATFNRTANHSGKVVWRLAPAGLPEPGSE